jgi:hypothetical protein
MNYRGKPGHADNCGHFRASKTDSVTEQKAMKVITVFAAWEYSHCSEAF